MGGIPSVRALPESLTSAEVRVLCGALYDEEWFEKNKDDLGLVQKRALLEEASSRSIEETSHVLLANLQQFAEVKSRLHGAWAEIVGTEVVHEPRYKTLDKTRDGRKPGECDRKWRQQCLGSTGVHVRNVDDLYVAAEAALPRFKEVLIEVLRDAGLSAEPYDHIKHTGSLMLCPTVSGDVAREYATGPSPSCSLHCM